MKVNDPRTELNSAVEPTTIESTKSVESAKPLESVKVADGAKTSGHKSPLSVVPDEVRLSPSLRLADEAVKAAAISGDVRPAAVARARALLATGRIGADLEHLADKIISSLTETRDIPSDFRP